MVRNSLMIDLDDPRVGKIADVINSSSCKKILNLLTDKELSASEISQELGMALNTVGYNLEKLVDAGLVEKSNKFFWSVKGKRVYRYRISNKNIIISPKARMKGFVSAILVSLVAAFGLKALQNWNGGFFEGKSLKYVSDSSSTSLGEGMIYVASESARNLAVESSNSVISNVNRDSGFFVKFLEFMFSSSSLWIWFLIGAFVTIIVFLVSNIRRKG